MGQLLPDLVLHTQYLPTFPPLPAAAATAQHGAAETSSCPYGQETRAEEHRESFWGQRKQLEAQF